ncbi:MAG: type IV pilin protein [Granulosicoccus sp.]|nr:type IV pilin protein [Granulosicoccus sp.]
MSETLQGSSENNDGFSLVELMVAVAILGILMAIAVPSYQNYLLSSRRIDARNALTDLSLRLEQRYSAINTYAGATIATNPATDVLRSTSSSEGYYTLSIGSATATGYTITATAIGSQKSDKKCGNFTLTSQGTKTTSGAGSVNDCW